MRSEDAKIGMRVSVHPDAWKHRKSYMNTEKFEEGVIRRKADTGRSAAIEFDHPIPDSNDDCHDSTKSGYGNYILWENLKPVDYSEEGWAVVKSDIMVNHAGINHNMVMLLKGDVGQIISFVRNGGVLQMMYFKTKYGTLKVPLIHLEDHPDVIKRRNRERITTKPVTSDQAVKQLFHYDMETTIDCEWKEKYGDVISAVSGDIFSGKSDLVAATNVTSMDHLPIIKIEVDNDKGKDFAELWKKYHKTGITFMDRGTGKVIKVYDPGKKKVLQAVIARRRK